MPEEKDKILRGCRAYWLTTDDPESETAKYTLLGKDSDSLSIDNNPNTESKKNVLGETVFVNNGYTPSLNNESYIARKGDSIYPTIQKINDELATDDATCGATMIVATLDAEIKNAVGSRTLTGKGYMVPVKLVVNNDGGDTSGYGLPFTVNEDGGRIQGNVSVTNKIPIFTAADQVPAESSVG